jgi:predicted ThiF/HesA family dinucleotide-utilizing enzyme
MNQLAAVTSEEKPGPRPAPLSERIVEARAAGTVTVLKACRWTVGEAIKKVADVTGLDADRLRYFRDEIHRGRADDLVRRVYDAHVRDFARITEMTREEIASYVLDVCAKYYSPGRPFRHRFDL